MKFFILSTVFIFLGLQLRAEEKKIEYKNWKTFQSDYGYEFKYPDCWDLMIDDPDETGDFRQIRNLTTLEKKTCETPRRDREIPNSVAFTAGYQNYYYDSLEKANKDKEAFERWSKAEQKNGRRPFFSRKKMADADLVDYVEILSNKSLRWHREVFCGQRRISMTGPSIMAPNDEYIAKLKAGDFALPEPEKTIYDSIRCIGPKISNGQKK